MWVTLNNPRGWGHIHNRFTLLPFHTPYEYSFGHLSFLLVFLCPSCFLQFCLMATVPQSCPLPSVDHPLPQSHRVVPAHSGLPISHRLSPFNMELFLPRVCPQLHVSTIISAFICLPKSVLCVSPACNGCYVWAGILWDPLPAWLQLWCVVVTQTGFRNGWTQHMGPYHGPCCWNPAMHGETYLKRDWEIKKLIFSREQPDTGKGMQHARKACEEWRYSWNSSLLVQISIYSSLYNIRILCKMAKQHVEKVTPEFLL